jgi:hypothetical protein
MYPLENIKFTLKKNDWLAIIPLFYASRSLESYLLYGVLYPGPYNYLTLLAIMISDLPGPFASGMTPTIVNPCLR